MKRTKTMKKDDASRKPTGFYLKIWPPRGEPLTVPLIEGEMSLGRAPENDVVLSDENVSRFHAKLSIENNRLMLKDLGSKNGTLYKGNYIKRSVVLEPGDEFFLAKTTCLITRDPSADVVLQTGIKGLKHKDMVTRSVIDAKENVSSDISETFTANQVDMELIERSHARFRMLFQLSTLVNSTRTPIDIAENVVHFLFNVYRPLKLLIMEKDAASGHLVPLAMRLQLDQEPVVSKEIIERVMRERISLLTRIEDAPVRAVMCAPLWVEHNTLGVIYFETSQKPFPRTWDLDTLTIIANQCAIALENAWMCQSLMSDKERLERENSELKQNVQKQFTFQGIIGKSRAMNKVFKSVQRVIESQATVLILGESGTGKELIARTIHYNGPRKHKPFIAINCAAIPDHLLEAELFGIEKGVATGVDQRIGRFEEAQGGSLFLDEIGEISKSIQVKLLRALEMKEISRVGSGKVRPVDIRIIAATNVDLLHKIKEGTFRTDLYYRLNVIPIYLPALKERRDDIIPLVNHFLKDLCRREKKKIKGLHTETWRKLMAYDWPGNVRELKNEVERLVVLAEPGTIIEPDQLSPKFDRVDPDSVITKEMLQNVGLKGVLEREISKIERRIILQTLDETNDNKARAARILKLSREGLRKKMIKLGLA